MFFSKSKNPAIEWNQLTNTSQFEEVNKASALKPVLIFKHSTRCSISAMALNRFERNFRNEVFKPYFLDVIANREVSNEVASRYSVTHESPQVILIKDEKVVHHSSHSEIGFEQVNEEAKKIV